MSSVARQWLDARERRDLDALALLTAKDAHWESPVVGEVAGRAAVVEQVRAGFDGADEFETELLSFERRGDLAAALIRNTGRRDDEELDSLQVILLHTVGDAVTRVRVTVDDPEAVESFWSSG
jgi:ketosteroid isomerase-like protein